MRTLLSLTLLILALLGCKKDEGVVANSAQAVARPAPARSIAMAVTDEGFVPANVQVKVGEPVTLVITRKTDETCATEILIEGTDIKQPLPLNQPVEVAWTPSKAGKVKFGCAMDMMVGGVLLVD